MDMKKFEVGEIELTIPDSIRGAIEKLYPTPTEWEVKMEPTPIQRAINKIGDEANQRLDDACSSLVRRGYSFSMALLIASWMSDLDTIDLIDYLNSLPTKEV